MSRTLRTLTDTERFNNVARYEALMEVVRTRMTNRAFAAYQIPRAHFEMILDAARHAPSLVLVSNGALK